MPWSRVLRLASLPFALLALRCSSSPTPCYQDAVCLSAADGGPEASSSGNVDGGDGGPTVSAPPGCDPAADAKDAPACAVDEYAIFVDAASGVDNAAGTKASPVKTIGAALGKLAGRPRIYLCEGTYAEAVKLTTSVSVYGGYACGSWTYNGKTPVVQAPTGGDFALDIAASNVTVSDVELDGPELGAPNSIAVRAVNATGVVFLRAKLVGKTGAKGEDGKLVPFTYPNKSDLDGKPGLGTTGGGERAVTCPDGAITKGGKGGDIGVSGAAGFPDRGGGAAGTVVACGATMTGGGAGGTGESPIGGAGALTPGLVSNDVWLPSAGAPGANGGPGQGGGGGAGLGDGAGKGAGGGGGAGGCGGAGGGAGSGGGASAAIFSIASAIIFRESELVAGPAGDGGTGAAGQPGQMISGSGGVQVPDGCSGGKGGPGGNGASGGGGAGGVSAGVLYKGTTPTFDPEMITKGTAGKKGIGGSPTVNDGIETPAQTLLAVQ